MQRHEAMLPTWRSTNSYMGDKICMYAATHMHVCVQHTGTQLEINTHSIYTSEKFMKPIVYGWKEIKVILISQKDFMEKAKLEWFFASQRELEKLCDSKSLSWPKERFSELSTNINLVKNPDPTIASYNVGHMSIYWIFPLVTAYFGLVKLHPISFCLSFGDVYLNKFLGCMCWNLTGQCHVF